MDKIDKPIPRFIKLNGYEVRAIYNGQEDVGKPQNKVNKNQKNEDKFVCKSPSSIPQVIPPLGTQNQNIIKTTEDKGIEKETNEHEKNLEIQITVENIALQAANENKFSKNDKDNSEVDERNEDDNEQDSSKVSDIAKSKDADGQSEKDVFSKEDDNLDNVEIPTEYRHMSHIDKVNYNWKTFKNFDRLNCSKEELLKFRAFKKLEWEQYNTAKMNKYKSLKDLEKKIGKLTPLGFEKMDSSEIYSFNMKEFKNFNINTANINEKTKYIACKRAEWKQRKKEFFQYIKDHERKQEERNLKKQTYQAKR
ncbi:uncharacterized protein LOC136075920 [Hydra vulgaris]|uniref:Uncharacterized protein LOC136075920 n=1 Tax=Hydra vulgaris TaxID=6087 RepID=A0ABM4B990_HYDVU